MIQSSMLLEKRQLEKEKAVMMERLKQLGMCDSTDFSVHSDQQLLHFKVVMLYYLFTVSNAAFLKGGGKTVAVDGVR
jgi:hypothetical protein